MGSVIKFSHVLIPIEYNLFAYKNVKSKKISSRREERKKERKFLGWKLF